MNKRLLGCTALLAAMAPMAALGLRVRDLRASEVMLSEALALLDAPIEAAPAPERMECRRALGLLLRVRDARGDDPAGRRAGALSHLARACEDLSGGRVVLARAEAELGARLAPEDPRAALWEGIVAARSGDNARAERALTRAEGSANSTAALRVRARVHRVDVLMDTGRGHEALGLVESLPMTSAAVANRVGLARAAVGDARGAESAFERATEMSPREEASWVNLARLSRARGELWGAREHLERAVALAPGSGEAWLAYGVVLSDLGDARAREALHRAQGLMADKAGPWVAEGALNLAAGAWEAAAESFREALSRAENDGTARSNLGVALARMGDRQGALTAFEEAARDAPELGAAWNGVGAMWLAMEQPARALGPLQQAAVLLPEDPNPSLNLGVALERLSRWNDAARAFRETLRRAPGNETARRHLAAMQPGSRRG